MFESILSAIKSTIATAARTVERVVRKSPWIVPAAILGLFFLL